MNFTECDITATLAESREVCKPKRKLDMLWKTVVTHRLKELRHLRTVEKLATWRISNGFDRCDTRDGQWIHSSLSPTPEETTASMWTGVNALKKEISTSEKERSKQRVKSFFNEIEQGTARLTDEEFARLERMIMERRGRAAAHVVVAPIDTAQHCTPRSSSDISFDVHVYMEGNTQVRMDPKRGQLESSSSGKGVVTPGQQCLPNWEMGRTTVDGCLLVGVSLNFEGKVFP